MADFSVVDPPRGLSYAAPLIDFGFLGNLPDQYRKGQSQALAIQDQQRQADVANAFKDGQLPLDPATGLPDYGKIMQVLASKGGIDAITRLAPSANDQAMLRAAGQTSPLLSPGGGSSAAPQGGASPPAPAAPASIPVPPATATAGYTPTADQPGSVVDIVTQRLPQNSQTTGAVIANIAKAAGVDPNAALTAEQSARVARLVDGYMARTGQSRPGTPGGPMPAPSPAEMADATKRLNAALTPAASRVTEGFADMGGQPAMAQASPADARRPPPAAPAATAGPAAAPPSAAGGQRIVPAEPLSPGFTDWQQNVAALEDAAAKRSRFNPTEARELLAKAERIRASYAPVKIGQYDTFVDPASGQTVAQGPMAKILAGGVGGVNAVTLDADAERYRQTGQLPPNMGRGIQGQAEAAAIRQRAVEHEVNAGGDPNQWPRRWQEYRAEGIGLNAGSRVRATREENLNLILKVTDSAIPAALEQSAKVWRSGFVPLNKIIQHGQVMTSDAELRAFGMANLQLAEGWARAMNPTGVMRESDREKALEFLSTADSPETYRRLVTQLQTQIKRERDSIRSGEPMRQGDSAPAPGVSASGGEGGGNVVRWERAPDGSLRQSQ